MDFEKTQRALQPLLQPASALYSVIMDLRAAAYAHNIFTSQKPKAFCVAVGNIAWGGSGKTPLADWLLSWAESSSLLPAVLTRGYGGTSEIRPLQVKPHTNPDESGDEPLMLSRRHPASHILADPSRMRALDWLNANTRANFIILDDAMQHLAIQRDLNLTLLRVEDLLGAWGKVIPAGSWREGPKALARADAFMLRVSKKNFARTAQDAKQRLEQFGKPVFSFDLTPTCLRPLETAWKYPALKDAASANLAGAPYALCTAVGNPESVRQSLIELLGYGPEQKYIYPDHHKFTANDLKKLEKQNLPVVITAKDAVKLQPLITNMAKPLFLVLESEICFGPALFSNSGFEAWFGEQYRGCV